MQSGGCGAYLHTAIDINELQAAIEHHEILRLEINVDKTLIGKLWKHLNEYT